jgi:hypothetical protein
MSAIDLTNSRFGRLVVLSRAENGKYSRTRWTIRCDCGKTKIVRADNLRAGTTRSCNCLRKEIMAATIRDRVGKTPGLRHGHTRQGCPSPTYGSFRAMKNRCINHPDYGGAGITVCDRWRGKDGFDNFLADMGERPAGTSLGRKNDVGNYEPGNVSWQTPAEQVANRRPDRARAWSKKKIKEQIAA